MENKHIISTIIIKERKRKGNRGKKETKSNIEREREY